MSASLRGQKSKSSGVTPYKVHPSPMYCRGCARPCRTKTSLDSHQRICPQLKLGKYDSFFKLDPLKKGHPSTGSIPSALQSLMPDPDPDKLLPPSQPLLSSTQTQNVLMDCRSETELNQQPITENDTTVPMSSKVNHETIGRQIPSPTNAVHSQATGNGIQQQQVQLGTESETDDSNCPICRVDVVEGVDGVCCDMCKVWSHRECLFMSPEDFASLPETWYCVTCLSIQSNKIKWGALVGEAMIRTSITLIYNEIITWRKNLFMVPRGKVGTDFIKEITNIINQFTIPSKWTRLALAKVHIFIPLMLQKPSSKSKAKDHAKYLERRLKLWTTGDLNAIMAENREIQKKLRHSLWSRKETRDKTEELQ